MTFSIISPVYNVAEYLPGLFRCVMAQEFSDWELIVVDDGSTDGCGQLLDKYASQNCRIRVFHQTNKGVSAARNAGLAVSRGEWIAFLDADDVVSPRWLSSAYEIISKTSEVEMLGIGFVEFWDGSDVRFDDAPGIVTKRDVSLGVNPIDVNGNFWDRMYRRDVIPACGFRKYALGEDLLFMLEALVVAKQLAYTSERTYGYRLRRGSAMRSVKSPDKISDDFRSAYDSIMVLSRCGKHVSPACYRGFLIRMTELAIFDIFQYQGDASFDKLYDHWMKTLLEVKVISKRFTIWYKWAIRVMCVLRWRCVAWLLFWMPHWLKQKGLHR